MVKGTKPSKKTTKRIPVNFAEDKAIQNEDVRQVSLHMMPIGASGTEIFSGYYSEDYLQNLQGTNAADAYDKMRRSDAKIKMVLSAVKNPIKSAAWSMLPADDTPEAKKISDLMAHILFEDMEKPFKQFLGEALSLVDFGFSVFEIMHKAVLNHPKFGSYNGIRSFGFRSQRTIERWNLDPDTGALLSVEQLAFGDVGKSNTIPGQFLVVFSLDKEGDNYEGISGLRACFGPWSRKQVYLKLMAIGIEKSAIPTPVADVPLGKENSTQFTNMIEVLKAYTSHQSAYITKPEGWKIDFITNPFDGEKLKSAIEFENKEISFAFLANFLELGMSGGGGSYALGSDLSDFFLGGIEHIASIICDQINMKVIPDLVKMNFGPQSSYPKLHFAGISDKIGQEFATILRDLVQTKVVIPDEELEKSVRQRMGLPKVSLDGQREVQKPQPFFSEKKSLVFAELTPKKRIKELSPSLKELMQKHLKEIAELLSERLVKQFDQKSELNEINALKDVTSPSLSKYKAELEQEFNKIASSGYFSARAELPKKLKAKFSESLQFEEAKLPERTKKRVKALTDLTADTQYSDLEKAVKFQYASSIASTDSSDLLKKDLLEAAEDFITGPSIVSGSVTLTSDLINQTRMDVFENDQEVSDEIESYTFVNGDPVSPICEDLAGTVFDAKDPEAARYFPPLHHNCKSYLVPNFKQNSGNPKLTAGGLKPSDKELEKYVTLSELKLDA